MRYAAAAVVAAALFLPAAAPAAPACFGAAARDPETPCHNPALRTAARPTLSRSVLTPNFPCEITAQIGHYEDRADGELSICEFGVPEEEADRTVALIGDSHAMAWRAAVAGTVSAMHWHGVDMARSHCAFSAATRATPERDEVTGCQRFNKRVLEWLRGHPEVTVAFVANQTGGTPYFRIGERSEFASRVYGFRLAWQSLPASVTQVFVIRDNPANHNGYDVQRCVLAARRAGRAPGPFCARPRSEALRPDAQAVAAQRVNDPRFALVDLTRFMCSAARCFPVVGGARVTKDGTHLTRMFSASLAPYLTRVVLGVL